MDCPGARLGEIVDFLAREEEFPKQLKPRITSTEQHTPEILFEQQMHLRAYMQGRRYRMRMHELGFHNTAEYRTAVIEHLQSCNSCQQHYQELPIIVFPEWGAVQNAIPYLGDSFLQKIH